MAKRSGKGTNKAARAREQYFPDVPKFEPDGNFSALPWVFRTILSFFKPRDWQLLTYLMMRSGPHGLSWFTDKQIGADVGIGHRKVGTHLKALEEAGFILSKWAEDGTRYICLVDPVPVIRQLAAKKKFTPDTLVRLNSDLATLELPSIDPEASPAGAPGAAALRREPLELAAYKPEPSCRPSGQRPLPCTPRIVVFVVAASCRQATRLARSPGSECSRGSFSPSCQGPTGQTETPATEPKT